MLGNSVLSNNQNSSNVAPQNENTIAQQFRAFQQQYRGNPQAQVMQMLQNGQITQSQLSQAIEQARQLRRLL